jgi:hypothetical protein
VTDETKLAVLAVLRRTRDGFARTSWSTSVHTGLWWWQRLLNWAVARLATDAKVFTDPLNYYRCEYVPLKDVADPGLIDAAMRELAPEPRCRICGSVNVAEDPAGYYCHAERYDGAPLLCLERHP